jgi:hypothetical protein
LDQRAWVSLVDSTGTPELNKPFEIVLIARNSGKTFAKEFTSTSTVDPVPRGETPNFSKGSPITRESVSIVAPNGNYVMKLYPFKKSPTEKLDQPSLDSMTSGDLTLFAYGRFDYRDVFGCPHWTIFCVRMTPHGVWESCKTHNDADDNHCQKK